MGIYGASKAIGIRYLGTYTFEEIRAMRLRERQMVDSMCAYLLGEESFLASQMPDIPLPCAEVLWDASSAKQWREVIDFADGEPTLAI